MVIHSTSAHCNKCDANHPANLIRTKNTIQAVVNCPKGDIVYDVSSDADMFLKLRKRSYYDSASNAEESKYILNYISITNACNFSCAVCGVNAVSVDSNPTYISAEEIYRRAEMVKKNGGRILHLFGGEPTLHPEIMCIVKKLSDMGFSTGMVTNGYLLGKDKELAQELKKRGLRRVILQFDSLKNETLDHLKRNYLDEKREAIKNAIEAGLNLGLNCTVTKHNLHEIGDLLTHGIELGVSVKNLTFASAAPIGRFLFSEDDSADKEQITQTLVESGTKYSLSFDDVFPLPSYSPWGISVHPDCGAHILLIRTPDEVRPLNNYINVDDFYKKLAHTKMKPNYISKRLVPACHLFTSIRKRKILASLRILAGFVFFKKNYSLLNIGITNYKAAAFLDEQRISKCASAFYTSVGPVKGCEHFFRDKDFSGSRKYEIANGSC